MSILDKASLIQIPSGYKSTKLYSLRPINGDGDFTFARSSSATRVNSEGLIEVASVLGSELIVNGDFASATGWSLVGDFAISGGKASITSASQYSQLTSQGTNFLTAGNQYKLQVDIETLSISGAFAYRFTGGAVTPILTSQIVDGKFEAVFTMPSNGYLWLQTTGSYTGLNVSIDNVSVKEVIENDIPRLDYSGGATCASLLLEPQRSNLYLNSEPTANEGPAGNISYIGTSFGLGFNNYTYYSDNSVVRYRYGGTCAATTEYTLSVFVIMNDNSSPNVSTSSTSGDFSIVIADGFATPISVTHYGNNIYRVIAKRTSGSSGLSNNGIAKYTGQSSVGFKAVGWQLEQGSYPTSYIPTSGSTVTRTADFCNNAGTSATFNSTEGVLFAEIAALADDSTQRFISLGDGTSNNRIILGYNNASNGIIFFIRVGGTLVANILTTINDIKNYNKLAVKWKENDFALWGNGVELGSDLSGVSFASGVLDNLNFLDADGTTEPFYGKTKQLMVFNEALSDEELSDLTGQVNLSFNNLATFYNYTIL